MAKKEVVNGLLPQTPDKVVPEQVVTEQLVPAISLNTPAESPVETGYGSRDFGKTRNQ